MLLTRRFWLGAIVTVGLVVLSLWKIDFGQIGTALQNANYSLFIPGVLIYFTSLWFRSLRWRYLLLHLKSIPARRLYPVVSIGYMANNILPARMGELVRAHFLGEKEGISKPSGLATIGVERVFDGLTLLFFVAVVWPFLPWTSVLKEADSGLWVVLTALIVLIFVAGFVVLFLCSTSPRMGRALVRIVTAVCPERFRPPVERFVYLLLEGLGALKSPRKLLLISLISIPVWLTEAAVYYVMAIAFDLELAFQVILLVTATSNLATAAIPLSIGGIGPFEVVAKTTLLAFGPDTDEFEGLAVTYSFFVHIVVLWLPVNILGAFFLWKEKVSLAQMVKSRGLEFSPAQQGEGGSVARFGATYEDKRAMPREGEEE